MAEKSIVNPSPEPAPRSDALAAELARVLRSEGSPTPDLVPAAEVVVTGRSTLHRIADRATGEQYLVKVPIVVTGWVDTHDVLPTAAQFEALERAYRWQSEEDRHAVVRPVALLPEHDAFAMEWAPGRTVLQALDRAPIDPRGARAAVRAAGDFLRRFHRHGLIAEERVALEGPVQEIRDLAAGPLRQAGLQLPPPVSVALDRLGDRTVVQGRALLHGDYVPSNLIVRGADEVVMIDPLLADVGPTVDDLARFLTVLSSNSAFLPGVVLPPVRRLRRSLEAAFRAAYGIGDADELLELRLLHQHLLRWLRRRENSRLRGVAPLLAARNRLIDRHMRALILESAARLAAASGAVGTPDRQPDGS
jgi:aminoglycoside phosphotransferase (APT) family kinase protein